MTKRNDIPGAIARDIQADAGPRAWQRMLSGRRLDLLDPSPADIEIEDIAHGLARVARWNGQTLGDHALSVAQHVLIVESIAAERNPRWQAEWRLAALLHDAAEYVVGDLISPFKNAIGLDYKSFEIRLLQAIHRRFNLPATLPAPVAAEIKAADSIAAYYEATVLAGFEVEEALAFFGAPGGISEALAEEMISLQPLPARDAQKRLLSRFADLASAS
ncbi:MAG: HD family hydrolase [Alphaproteobacteria bacterium]|nr:HD family hydrolase [Alphaproteobacteria bacterium]